MKLLLLFVLFLVAATRVALLVLTNVSDGRSEWVLPKDIDPLDVIGLDLSNHNLTVIPDIVCNLTSLRYLDLNHNNLTVLPGCIGNLKELRELHIQNNNLTILPDSIGDLKELRDLRLSNNSLVVLPDSIGNLTKLMRLSLDFNNLAGLPDSIGNLTKLEYLYLFSNSLTVLPRTILSLKDSILWLSLSGNPNLQKEGNSRDTVGWRELREAFGDHFYLDGTYMPRKTDREL